jgi:hypothetical protein
MNMVRYAFFLLFLISVPALVSCDGGLQPPPPDPDPVGVISGTVTYSGNWPPQDELKELLFVPLKFTPNDFTEVLSEFLKGNLRSSERLQYYVSSDTFIVNELENGVYIYNIIANQYGPNSLADWRPIGVYQENDGLIFIENDTVFISIHVDFDNLPPFPPE